MWRCLLSQADRRLPFDSCCRPRRVFVKPPHKEARLFLVPSTIAAQYVRQRRLWWLTVFSCPVVPVSLSSPILLLASRASFAASSLAALHALHPQNALLVGGWRGPSFHVSFLPLEYACGVHRVAPRPVVSPWLPRSFWSSHCDLRRRQMSLACPSPHSHLAISSLIVPWVFEALGRVDIVIAAEIFFFCCENSGVKRGPRPTGGPRPTLPTPS